MGSRLGYAYDFRLKMLEADEITSRFTSKKKDGVKTFIFEFTTNFILKIRPEEEAFDLIIDSEKFDAFIYQTGDERKDFLCLSFMVNCRLMEYWMTAEEQKFLHNETLDFTRNLASEYVSLNQIPVGVCLEVRTVQQEGEAYNDALDRAIRAEHLFPLDMCSSSIARGAFTPMCCFRKSFLTRLLRVRVENVEEGLALMPVCHICSRSCKLGAQISTLPKCGHVFHSHCIFRWIEANGIMCPSCLRPGFDHLSELM
ncbi:hypothetical protein CASFOL_038185 [Castilleja foliolosa]|uniref:RING-type E3 ubiquitin transferase n=1 Tax=Castilleja foliolosa TaxID=1961234 RepID=A0ABD3BKS1_9LAMI